MLNFIVLGYIPGTTYQITFFEYLAFTLLTAGLLTSAWYFLYFDVRKKAKRIAAIQLVAL